MQVAIINACYFNAAGPFSISPLGVIGLQIEFWRLRPEIKCVHEAAVAVNAIISE
jgi:hypothetical protein